MLFHHSGHQGCPDCLGHQGCPDYLDYLDHQDYPDYLGHLGRPDYPGRLDYSDYLAAHLDVFLFRNQLHLYRSMRASSAYL